MNVIYLYQVWKQEESAPKDTRPAHYALYFTSVDLEEVQTLCENSNGKYVYTFLQSFYGENG